MPRRFSSYSLHLSAIVLLDYASLGHFLKVSAAQLMPVAQAFRVFDPLMLLDTAPSHSVVFLSFALLGILNAYCTLVT